MEANPKLVLRISLLAMVVGLAVLTRILDPAQLDRCFIDRATERSPSTFIPVRDSLLNDTAVGLLWSVLLFLAAIVPRRKSALYDVMYAALWFHATYWLLYAGKGLLDDTSCSPAKNADYLNGISGHYCYFSFCMLGLPMYFDMRLRENPEIASRRNVLMRIALLLLLVLVLCFMVAAVGTLYRTFMHGYHTGRQVFYGTALGISSHLALDLAWSRRKSQHQKRLAIELPLLALMCCAGIVGYLATWPRDMLGHAVDATQGIGHTFAWTVLLFCGLTARPLPVEQKTKSE